MKGLPIRIHPNVFDIEKHLDNQIKILDKARVWLIEHGYGKEGKPNLKQVLMIAQYLGGLRKWMGIPPFRALDKGKIKEADHTILKP